MATTDIVQQITDGMTLEIATTLGATYKELPYIYDVAKNNFRTSKSRYGVRPLSTSEINGVVKATTHTQAFEVVLTEGYIESAIGDSKIQQMALLAFENMYTLYQQIVKSKAGIPNSVLLVGDLAISEPEILEEDKVLILRASINILYRIEL